MSQSIFQIENEYKLLVAELMENGGEATPEIEEALKINKEQLTHKGQSYGFVIRAMDHDITAIDEEIKRLNAHKKSASNVIERLKTALSNAMNLYEIDEIKTPLMKINFRKSESVEVDPFELSKLPNEYITIKQEYVPDKKKIKEAIKMGLNVPGALVVTKQNIQIK